MDINQIRDALGGLPRASNGKLARVPETLRTEILRGGSNFNEGMEGFAAEIGMSYSTIMGWKKSSLKVEKSKPSSFRRLEIKPEPTRNVFSVEGPRGLKVTGLSLIEIGMLFREVSQ